MNELQEVVVASWRIEKPLVETHVGDLAWWSREPDARRHVWHDGDTPVAWGWISGGELDFHVRADRRGIGLEDEVLGRFDGGVAWALDTDASKLAALEAAGYAPRAGAGFHHLVRGLAAHVRFER